HLRKEGRMGKKVKWFLALLVCVTPAHAQERAKLAPPSVTEHVWEAAFLENGRAGYFHSSFEPIEADGQKLIRSRQSLHLTVKRFKSVIQLRMQHGTDETEQGKVAGVFMQLEQAAGPLVLSGTVKDNVLHVEVDKGRIKREIPWNDKVIG